jgi:TetR/AcrR family transcriptional regulator, mexJK operon transcriptional repressor
MPGKIIRSRNSKMTPREDRDETLRQRLLSAATHVFLERGYAAASVDEMASRAKASKITFYNHYGNKEKLFEAVILRHSQTMLAEFSTPLKGEPNSLRKMLENAAQRILQILMAPENVRFLRLIHAEAERFPRFAEVFEECGPAQGQKLIASQLERQMAKGVLKKSDPILAAQHFLSLTIGELSRRILLGLRPLPTKAETDRQIESAVDVFLLAYAP